MKRLLLILSFVFFATHLSAQNGFSKLEGQQLNDFQKNLMESSEKINTLACSFVQTQNLSLLAEEIKSTGTMTYKSPSLLNWSYTSPSSFVFLVNGNSITTKTEQSKTTIDSGSNSMMQELCKIMVAGLKGDTKSLEGSFTTKYLTNGKQVNIEMSPKNKAISKLFKQITVTFNANSFLVETITLTEASGDNTIINIKDVKLNAPVDESIFN